MSEMQDKPEGNNKAKEIVPGQTINESSSTQTSQEMEVHHHGHVPEKKKWKEYIFQFFMLFLAVYLGSLAETKREENVERKREKEYIISMVSDIKNDTPALRLFHSVVFEQIQKIDSLEILFSHDLKNNSAEVRRCYELSTYLPFYAVVAFNEKTISQLLNSGNMRVIKENGVADSIMGYYNLVKVIEQQKQQYINYINLTVSAMYKVFDVSYLRGVMNPDDSTLYWSNIEWEENLHLRTTDPANLKELSATLETTKLVIFNYMFQLGFLRERADRLINFLNEEYHIKKNEGT